MTFAGVATSVPFFTNPIRISYLYESLCDSTRTCYMG